MRIGRVKHTIKKATDWLEIIISIIIAIGVIIGLIDFAFFFVEIFQSNMGQTYDVFQAFLGYALLLIVGIELILMILYHSTSAILELVLFVIARKMLICAETMSDLVLGTLAMAIVFFIMRYLLTERVNDFVARKENHFAGGDHVRDVMTEMGIALPTSQGETLAELIEDIADNTASEIKVGAQFQAGQYYISIISLTPMGQIDQVKITKAA